MKKIVFLVFASFLFFGCAQNKVDLFEKNQECYKYKKDMQIKNGIDPLSESNNDGNITSIFYSPKLDTCLYLYTSLFDDSDDFYSSQRLDDVFTGETIEFIFASASKTEEQYKFEEFRNKVKEYQ